LCGAARPRMVTYSASPIRRHCQHSRTRLHAGTTHVWRDESAILSREVDATVPLRPRGNEAVRSACLTGQNGAALVRAAWRGRSGSNGRNVGQRGYNAGDYCRFALLPRSKRLGPQPRPAPDRQKGPSRRSALASTSRRPLRIACGRTRRPHRAPPAAEMLPESPAAFPRSAPAPASARRRRRLGPLNRKLA
jgi:hypothetical protein